jgi:hypothetical protein
MKHSDSGEHIQSKPCHPLQGHTHRHGPQCGHLAVQHDDHIDFEHDGHFHRMHGDHFHECEGPKPQ